MNYTALALASLAYDGIWAIAVGLDIATRRIAAGNDSSCDELPGDLVPLEQFNYTNEKLGCIMRQSLSQVEFLGLTVSLYIYIGLLYALICMRYRVP